MNPFIWLIITVIQLYTYIVVATVIVSWLIAFNVINLHNPVVRQITYILGQLTEPLLDPIRRVLPSLGGLDISPVILLLLLYFLQRLILWYVP